MQKECMNGVYKKNEIIKNISKLIDKFNSKNYKVIQSKVWITNPKKTSMTKLWPNEGIANTKGAEMIPELKDKNYDKIIKKTNYSAFFGTKLDDYLKKNKVNELYIAGIHSGCCILFTGVDAFYRNYDVYFVKDAISSAGGKKFVINALKNFEMFCGKTISTSQVIKHI